LAGDKNLANSDFLPDVGDALLMLGLAVVQAATVEERLEQINRMGDKARAEVLEKKANKQLRYKSSGTRFAHMPRLMFRRGSGGEGRESNPTRTQKQVPNRNKFNNF
jgi:hypothetical protein